MDDVKRRAEQPQTDCGRLATDFDEKGKLVFLPGDGRTIRTDALAAGVSAKAGAKTLLGCGADAARSPDGDGALAEDSTPLHGRSQIERRPRDLRQLFNLPPAGSPSLLEDG